MKSQVNTLALAFSAAALVPTSQAFATVSSSQLRIGKLQPTHYHHASLTSLEATTRSDSETVLSAALVEPEVAFDTTNNVEEEDIVPQDDEKLHLKDGFVFGLEGSGLERPKGKVANVVVEGDSLETQPYQVAMVAGTFLAHAGFASVSYLELLAGNGGNILFTAIQSALIVVSSWLLADLGSGVLHWSVDNYGNGRTPVMGSIIAAFQGHHSAPWTITERGFCNNVYKLCIPFGVVPITLISLITGPAVTLFFTFFCVTEILSQEFHKWSHMTKKQCPEWVHWLQNAGVTIGRTPHAMHHIAPYDGNYCIISGIWNDALDKSGIFRWMEHMVYKVNGVESNAWKLDADLRERTLRGEYGLPESA